MRKLQNDSRTKKTDYLDRFVPFLTILLFGHYFSQTNRFSQVLKSNVTKNQDINLPQISQFLNRIRRKESLQTVPSYWNHRNH